MLEASGYACKNKDRLRAGGNSKIKLLKRESKDSPEAPTSNFFKIKWWVIHIICIGWKIGSFFDHLDLQIIKFDMFNKLILSKTGFGVKLEIVDIRIQPDRFA